MPAFKVALELLGHRGVPADAAYQRLCDVLGADALGDMDSEGFVEVTVDDVQDFDEALARVWNAMATAGADDHFVFAEHPDIPDHWRRRGGGDSLPGAHA